MNRHIFYPGAIPLETDVLNIEKDAYYGDGWLASAAIGTTTSVVGLAVTPTGPASLQVNVAPGAIFSLQTVDASAYGSLGTDANQVVKMGIAAASSTLTITPPGTVGQSINYLVQVQFSETDGSPVVLPYYNAGNPAVAWSGPNNTGTAQNTVRTDSCVIQLKAGTPAATGSQTTPAPDAGYTGIYVITCAQGQTTITAGNIALLATAPYFPNLPQVPTAVQAGQWIYAAAAGSVNVYTATLAPIPPALVTGMEILVNFGTANTSTTPTLNVNALGAKSIIKQSAAAVAVGDVTGYIPLIYDGTNWRINGFARSDAPIISLTGRTLYVRTDGNDANNGSANTAGSAFLTIAAAVSYGLTTSFLIGQILTVQLGNAGTYAPPAGLNCASATVLVRGDPAAQASYIISGAGPGVGGAALIASVAGALQIVGVTVQNTGTINNTVAASGGGSTVAVSNVTFSSSVSGTFPMLLASGGGTCNIGAGCIFNGNAGNALLAQSGSIIITANFTVGSTPTFTSAFAAASNNGNISLSGAFTISGAATGTRYAALANGVINTGGGGANFFPGNVAGAVGTGGQYL